MTAFGADDVRSRTSGGGLSQESLRAQLKPIRTELTMMIVGALFVLFAVLYGLGLL